MPRNKAGRGGGAMTAATIQLPPSIPVSALPGPFLAHWSPLEIGGSWPDLAAWQSCSGLECYDGQTQGDVSEQTVRADDLVNWSAQPDVDWSCSYCDDFAFVLNVP
jgi:hypothetical protein